MDILDLCWADFNESLLVFLPKSPVASSTPESPVYHPSGVRPLNIANTDNRLLASAVRLAIEPTLDRLITPLQRGFLQGRSMIANLLDIEESMFTTAADSSQTKLN